MNKFFPRSLARFLQFMPSYEKGELVLIGSFAVGTFVCDISLPWFLKDILSGIISPKILTAGLLFPILAIGTLRTLFSFIHARLNASFLSKSISAISKKMAISCVDRPPSSSCSLGTERISIYTEALIIIEQFIDSTLWQTSTLLLYCIGSTFIVIYLGGPIVLLAFVPFVIGMTCSYALRERIGKEVNALFSLRAKTGELFSDFIDGREILYAYQAQTRALSLFENLEVHAQGQRRKAYLLLAIYPAVFEVIGFLGIIAILLVGYSVLRRTQEIGNGMASILYLGLLARTLFAVSPLFPLWSRFKIAVDRLEEIFERDNLVSFDRRVISRSGKSGSSGIIVEKVYFSYSTSKKMFQDFSYTFKSNASTALVGPNGVGKSTLLKLILGEMRPDSGEVAFENCDKPLERTAYLPQEPFLFRMSILENLRIVVPEVTEEEIWKAAEALNLLNFLETRPRGLDSFVGERGAALSGGERQKISLLRFALRAKYSLFCLLDEPTSYVDIQSESALMNVLLKLCSGKTTVIVSHRPWVIEQCDETLPLAECLP